MGDIPVNRAGFHQFLVPADPCDLSLIQDQDLVGVKDSTDPLGNDEKSCFCDLFLQRVAQRGIRLKVQGGKTVVEHIEIGCFDQSPGDGEALPLAAGKIGAALGYMAFQAARQIQYKIRLCGFQGADQILSCGVRIAIAEIFLDGAGKEPGSLGDIGNGASQFRLGKAADVGSL